MIVKRIKIYYHKYMILKRQKNKPAFCRPKRREKYEKIYIKNNY